MEPMTPPECDLQDFPFMPLHVARLRDSDLAAEESPEACWYAVLLWAASWHQLPAASLPDNDAVLARLCGLGRDVRTFRKHKVGAMRGFVLCDDGRLYHPVVAEQARDAWESKLQQRWRTECARIKKANQRNGTEHPCPSFEEWLSRSCPEDVPRDTSGTGRQRPSGNGIQETGTGTGTGIIPQDKSCGDRTARGSRLPADFQMPDDWLAWAVAERHWSSQDAQTEAESFIDYWHAKPGKDGTKLDWQATWRNWVRNARRAGIVSGGRDAIRV